MAPVKACFDKRTDLLVKFQTIGKFYPKNFKLQVFRKEASTSKSVATAFSINEVANKMHSVLFGTSLMLSAV